MSKDLKLFLSQKKVKNSLIYSYWFDEWATVLAIAKKRSVIDYFVCRSMVSICIITDHQTTILGFSDEICG